MEFRAERIKCSYFKYQGIDDSRNNIMSVTQPENTHNWEGDLPVYSSLFQSAFQINDFHVFI